MFESGLVVGKFAPLHKGHELLLHAAIAQCRQVTVLVYANPDFADMPQAVRVGWLRALFPSVRVLAPDAPPPDSAGDEVQRAYVRSLLEARRIGVDAVFTSEDYGDGFAAALGAAHVMVDRQRVQVPISGSAIRQDPYRNRQFLSPPVYRHFVRTVVFLGAESTGKSTLTQRLAEAGRTAFVREYGRDYYAERGGKLTLDDYVAIAKGHWRLEDEGLMEARDVLFIDTNAITTLFYSYYYNGGARAELHEMAAACPSRYDFTFVCDTDIPFEQDGWRDSEVLRDKMQRMILMDLTNRGVVFEVVSGSVDRRMERVMAALGRRAAAFAAGS